MDPAKVYVVVHYEWDSSDIEGIFADEADAMMFIDSQDADERKHYMIEDWIVQ